MTRESIADMIEGIGLPFAYYQFDEPTEPPFICFFYPNSDDMFADNINYARIDALVIELYTDDKRFDLEEDVEEALVAAEIPFTKSEAYIDSEHMFQITYNMEVLITNG